MLELIIANQHGVKLYSDLSGISQNKHVAPNIIRGPMRLHHI